MAAKQASTIRNNEIAQEVMSGMTYREIAKKHNISPSRVCQVLKQDNIKEIIEQGTTQMIAMIPLATDTVLDFLNDKSEKQLRFKAAETVLKTVSIIPGAIQNQTINNIYSQTNNIITAETMELVRKLLPGFNEEVIDADTN